MAATATQAMRARPTAAARVRPPVFVRGELGAAAWAVALLVSMFALKWYGIDGIPGRSPSVVSAVDAWNGLTVLSRLAVLAAVLTIASVLLHLSQRFHGTKTNTSWLLAIIGTVVAGALTYRVLIELPAPASVVDQKLGAVLGVGCALGMAVCAWIAVGATRAARAARLAATPAPEATEPTSSEVGLGEQAPDATEPSAREVGAGNPDPAAAPAAGERAEPAVPSARA